MVFMQVNIPIPWILLGLDIPLGPGPQPTRGSTRTLERLSVHMAKLLLRHRGGQGGVALKGVVSDGWFQVVFLTQNRFEIKLVSKNW